MEEDKSIVGQHQGWIDTDKPAAVMEKKRLLERHFGGRWRARPSKIARTASDELGSTRNNAESTGCKATRVQEFLRMNSKRLQQLGRQVFFPVEEILAPTIIEAKDKSPS